MPSVLITGASSGLGEAMAREFARRGFSLALTARRTEQLDALKKEIQQTHPDLRIEIAYLDVCDTESVAPCLQDLAERMGSLDIIIANAGVAGSSRAGSGKLGQDMNTLQTNIQGAIATIDAAVAYFKPLKKGQIVGISSVAAARGMPGTGAYSASKAALATYLESVRAELHKTGVTVTTLFPGYIDTPLNRNVKVRPFLIDSEEGARQLVSLIVKKVQTSTVPVFPWNVVRRVLRWLPTSLISKL